MNAVTMPKFDFRSNNPRKVGRTLAAVKVLQADGVKVSIGRQPAATLLREYGELLGIRNVYWTLAAQMLGAR